MTTTPGDFSTTAGLVKLTVPQLKGLCKERRIVGYSKLGKLALIQKLTLITIPDDGATHNLQPVPPTQMTIRAPEVPEPTSYPVCQPPPCLNGVISLDTHSTQAKCKVSSATQSGTKRRISAVVKSAKKQKNFPVDAVSIHPADSSNTTTPSVTESSHQVVQVCRSPHRSSISSTVPIVTRHAQPVQTGSSTKHHSRFKPLVLTKAPPPASTLANSQRITFNDLLADESACIFLGISLKTAPLSIPPLANITLPPKLSDRKRVQSWAIILYALSDEDRQTCTLVSRAFRYAVYLSAAHILAQKYHGHRLDQVMKRYPQNMTNMWPYLRQRQNEAPFWRGIFQNSFVGRYISALGIEPLSARLWASPDDEKQVIVALRFVLTRLWFTLSVGTNGQDPLAWLKYTVEDAQEVVKGEIWAITVRDRISLSVFYALESTCEVIGSAHTASQFEVYSFGLRSDWSEYISAHTGASVESRSLILEHLRWANHEEYDRGVSRHWLHRISGEGDAVSKKVVAERYVMACVVANSISGQWMSSHGMAQEFAGLPSTATVGAVRERTPRVNLYLPAHHHVESVHFTTPKGVPFHPALAVIQTPTREYIVLKDNGMQVGCEEDGVANVWMHVLGCDQNGVAVICSK